MSDNQQPLIIKDFQKAVADSPHLGHALMRNLDIEMSLGAMKVQKKMLPMAVSITQRTFTVDASTDIGTAPSDLRTQAEIDAGITFYYAPVTFTTTGTLPAGLSLNTIYFLIYLTNTTFKVATTWINADAATAINITDIGTGTHTIVPVSIGTINHIRKDTRGSGYYYAIDSNGRVWNTRGSNYFFLLPGNGTNGAGGNGLSLFRSSDGLHTWLFAFRSAKIDVVDVFGNTQLNTPSWTNDWQSLNSAAGSGYRHECILAQDNITYFTDDRYVGSIMEKAGQIFDPTSAATYAYNNQALDLPIDDRAQCFEELGVNLLVGGLNFNKIYPWDRISDSFNLPIAVPEKGIYVLRNLGNLIYIFAGRKGNVYTTQGSYVKLFKTLSTYVVNNALTLTSSQITWGDVQVCNGALIFGVGATTASASGIYKLYPDARLLQDNTPYGGAVNATAIWADNDFYVVGYAGGFDYSTTDRYVAGTYAAVYQSELFRVGNKTEKATYSSLEIQTATPATTGQIRIGYRYNKTGTFTTTTANTFTADSSSLSFENGELGLIDLENIQFQIEFDGEFEIMEMRLYP